MLSHRDTDLGLDLQYADRSENPWPDREATASREWELSVGTKGAALTCGDSLGAVPIEDASGYKPHPACRCPTDYPLFSMQPFTNDSDLESSNAGVMTPLIASDDSEYAPTVYGGDSDIDVTTDAACARFPDSNGRIPIFEETIERLQSKR